MLNEPDVESFLESRGFVSVQIQDFTNEQQFELFRKATSIVAVRGASVVNLLAIERPLKFISIRPTSDRDGATVLHSFTQLNDIKYGEVRGDGYDRQSDFRIDLSCLEAELDRLEIH
jgi:capsular polysaccharide biosynthesis protein